jgi:hypothetical protein
MRGITQETFKYVLRIERELPTEEKTIWHLKIITAYDSAASLNRYSKSFRNVGPQNEVIEANYRRAYKGEWLDIVKQVENFQFGFKHPELAEKGYMSFDDPDLIGKVFEELPDGIVREIIDAAKGEVLVDEYDRKK